jgi:hypothetical protein
MQKRNVLNSPRLSELKKRRRYAFLTKFLIFILLFGTFIGLGTYFSRLDDLNIDQIEISGIKTVEKNQVEQSVQAEISENYLWLFPKTNVLIYPKKDIRIALQNDFSRLTDIDLSLKDKKTLLVSVSEREPAYLWCGMTLPDEASELEENKCYFMDREGYIFDEAPYFSGEVYFKLYGPIENENAPVGSYFSPKYFTQLISFKDTVMDMGIEPVMLNLLAGGDVEMFLAKKGANDRGPKIIFQPNADLENVAENLQAALSTEPLLSGMKNKYSKLEYIDLRFGNKVYFKFSGQSEPASGGQ